MSDDGHPEYAAIGCIFILAATLISTFLAILVVGAAVRIAF